MMAAAARRVATIEVSGTEPWRLRLNEELEAKSEHGR